MTFYVPTPQQIHELYCSCGGMSNDDLTMCETILKYVNDKKKMMQERAKAHGLSNN